MIVNDDNFGGSALLDNPQKEPEFKASELVDSETAAAFASLDLLSMLSPSGRLTLKEAKLTIQAYLARPGFAELVRAELDDLLQEAKELGRPSEIGPEINAGPEDILKAKALLRDLERELLHKQQQR